MHIYIKKSCFVATYFLFLLFLVSGNLGCTTSHEILKYDSSINNNPYNLIPGLEAEESSKKIIISVRGKGLEPAQGTPQQKRLMAERAAIIDGYRRLSERLAGAIISVYSASGNNNIAVDQVVSETNAYLRGAQVQFIAFENGIATAHVKVYITPRQFKFYHGSKLSRAIIGALTGAAVGTVVGSAGAAALGTNSATLEALGGTSGIMNMGAAAGALGSAAITNN